MTMLGSSCSACCEASQTIVGACLLGWTGGSDCYLWNHAGGYRSIFGGPTGFLPPSQAMALTDSWTIIGDLARPVFYSGSPDWYGRLRIRKDGDNALLRVSLALNESSINADQPYATIEYSQPIATYNQWTQTGRVTFLQSQVVAKTGAMASAAGIGDTVMLINPAPIESYISINTDYLVSGGGVSRTLSVGSDGRGWYTGCPDGGEAAGLQIPPAFTRNGITVLLQTNCLERATRITGRGFPFSTDSDSPQLPFPTVFYSYWISFPAWIASLNGVVFESGPVDTGPADFWPNYRTPTGATFSFSITKQNPLP